MTIKGIAFGWYYLYFYFKKRHRKFPYHVKCKIVFFIFAYGNIPVTFIIVFDCTSFVNENIFLALRN